MMGWTLQRQQRLKKGNFKEKATKDGGRRKKKKKKKKKNFWAVAAAASVFFFFFGFVKGAGWERERPWPTKRPFGGSVLSALTGGLKKTCVARARYGGGQVMPAEQRGQAESPWWEE